MIWIALVFGAVGLFLSAFFSGSETGFYRATRLRLVLDAMGGDYVSRGLLWLTNHASLFVATTLVGNNLANYLTSLAIVMAAASLASGSRLAELIAPLVLAPVLFVYGESLPKNLFLQAPNRLLRRGGSLFLGFTVLFFPFSGLLWLLNKLLAWLMGESPEQVRLAFARRELRRVMDEGHEAGILRPSQRALAQGIFAVANQSVRQFLMNFEGMPRARSDMSKDEMLRLASRYRIPLVPVEEAGRPGHLVGYFRVIDVGLSANDTAVPVWRLLEIPEATSHLAALTLMEGADEPIARVVGQDGETLGLVTAERLRQPLFPAIG